MGSLGTRPHNPPSRPGSPSDRHKTAPKCSCVNGRAHARNNGRQQCDRFCIHEGIPATEKNNTKWRTAWEVSAQSKESQKTEVLSPAESTAGEDVSLLLCQTTLALWWVTVWHQEVNLPSCINDGRYHSLQWISQCASSGVNAIVCPSCDSWHALHEFSPIPCLV